jgi:hypothetical protein
MESRPFLTRIPDQSLILEGEQGGAGHIAATRDSEDTYALIYFAAGTPATLDLSRLTGDRVCGEWFDPRTGERQLAGEFKTAEQVKVQPPTEGPGEDWVLVVNSS